MGTDILLKKKAKDNYIEIAYLYQRNVTSDCAVTQKSVPGWQRSLCLTYLEGIAFRHIFDHSISSITDLAKVNN